jgi:hypothetical protein
VTDKRGIVLTETQVDLIRQMYFYTMPNSYVPLPEETEWKIRFAHHDGLTWLGDEEKIICRYKHAGNGLRGAIVLMKLGDPPAWRLVDYFAHLSPYPLTRQEIDHYFCEPVRQRKKGIFGRLSRDDQRELARREAYLQAALN